MIQVTRCKMRLGSVIPMTNGSVQANYNCEYDPKIIEEDVGFSKYTPSGKCEFVIDNPTAIEKLVIGDYYYFDITPVSAQSDD